MGGAVWDDEAKCAESCNLIAGDEVAGGAEDPVATEDEEEKDGDGEGDDDAKGEFDSRFWTRRRCGAGIFFWVLGMGWGVLNCHEEMSLNQWFDYNT